MGEEPVSVIVLPFLPQNLTLVAGCWRLVLFTNCGRYLLSTMVDLIGVCLNLPRIEARLACMKMVKVSESDTSTYVPTAIP